MLIARFRWILVLATLFTIARSQGNEIVNTQWVIFDGDRTENLFGNPIYNGAFGAPYIPNQIAADMKFGLRHVIALTNAQKLWGWGGAGTSLATLGFGVVAAGLDLRLPRPLFLDDLEATFVSVGATSGASFAVESNGTIYYTGIFTPTLSTSVWKSLPVASGSPSFVSIKCGYAHCVAQDSAGDLWGVGYNAFGQAALTISLPNNYLNALTKIALTGTVGTGLYCTGTFHTMAYTSTLVSGYTLYGMGHCSAVNGASCAGSGTNFGATAVNVVAGLPLDGTPAQLECGSFHTVVRTSMNSVYATGANDKGQVVPPGSVVTPPSFVAPLVPVYPLRNWPNHVVVVANTTFAKNAQNALTGWGMIPSLLPQLGGGGSGGEAGNMSVSYSRPPWLRMTVASWASSSPWKPIFGIRFSEDTTCTTPRPLSVAVCIAGRWVSQRALQLASDRTYDNMAMQGGMTIYGDFMLNSSASLTMSYPDSNDEAIMIVDGCAEVQGSISVSLTKDNINNIRKKHSGKIELKLIQSNCAMLKRDVSVVVQEFSTPDDGYSETPGVPDDSVEPTDSTRASSSTSSVTVSPTASPSSSSSSSCSKTSSTTSETSNSDGTTTLVAVISVDSSGCNTWWIILVSVVGGIIVLVGIAAIVIFATPSIRAKVLPYRGS